MSDHFGSLTFPVPVLPDGYPVSDPTLTYIGSYLTACLNSQMGSSWGSVNPGRKPVESFQTQAPGDTFNERDLPCLYLWRSSSTDEQCSDDWTETITDITLTWVPQTADQAKRSLRASGINGLSKVITRALALGRSPSWVDPQDTDPQSLSRGSSLMERARLFRRPFVTSSRMDTVVIEKSGDTSTYPAFTVILKIHEITEWDESFDSIMMANRAPTKLDETVTSGNFTLESLIPTT